jgi:cholesterol transport system auxiliary component
LSEFDVTATRTEGDLRARQIFILAAIGLAAQVLTACATSSSPVTFDLTAPADVDPTHVTRGQLVVSVPTALPPFDGDRLIVRTGPQSLAVQKDSQWSDSLPRLVQARLIQSFENGHLLRSVGYPGQGISANVVLNSEIRHFEIEAQTGEATVEIAGRLVSANGQILAARVFSAQAAGSTADGAASSAALDRAFGQVAQQMVAWAATKL